MSNDGFSGFLIPYGCGLCLMGGSAERAIRVGGGVLVMVEFESKRERDQKQRNEERQFPVRDHGIADVQGGPPVARDSSKYILSRTVRPVLQPVFLGRVTLISRTRFRRASFVTADNGLRTSYPLPCSARYSSAEHTVITDFR